MSETDVRLCESCGASIYPEHITSGKAGMVDEKLYCPHCLAEHESKHHASEPRITGQATMRAPGEGADLEPLAMLDDDEHSGGSSLGNIRAIGQDTLSGAAMHVDDSDYKRPLDPNAAGATRCRTFHAKLNDGAVAFMNRQINEWADMHADVTIKYATSTIGVWEGKKADAHLIVTVFY